MIGPHLRYMYGCKNVVNIDFVIFVFSLNFSVAAWVRAVIYDDHCENK